MDTSGRVFVTGQTHSADYPITAATALQPSFTLAGSCQGSGSDPYSAAFVSKLSSDGTKLLYSTFVGGTSVGSGNLCDQYATTTALDGSGNIWTIGATGADSFPTTANAYSQMHFGAADIYVHEISADGRTLLYGTYFGGSGNDFPTFGMAMDSSGDIYFGGVSASGADYPLKDSVQAFGGSNDAVVTEILPGAGSTSLVFSTFLGRSSDDVGQGLALDSQGNIHLSGATDSTNFPVVNALQTQFADSIASPDHNDAFIAEFGSGLIGQVTPSTGGNFGSTTITLNGAGFENGAAATLESGGSPVASGQFVKASADGATLRATFDLTSVAPGTYDVKVVNPDTTSFLAAHSFTVVAGGGTNLWARTWSGVR